MATRTRPEPTPGPVTTELDYYAAEGIPRPQPARERAMREWTMVAAGLAGLVALLAIVVGASRSPRAGPARPRRS